MHTLLLTSMIDDVLFVQAPEPWFNLDSDYSAFGQGNIR
jgi:hypothetical protein